MRVLVTRAEPAASRTAALLEEQGHDPVKMPTFEIVDTGAPVSDERFTAAIFTSGNAVDVLAKRGWTAGPEMTAFCVGERTAAKSRDLGFAQVVTGEGGGRKLADKIVEAGFGQGDMLAYFTTPDRSFELADHLAQHGIKALNIELYQARRHDPDLATVQNIFQQGGLDCVLCYSRRSAAVLADLIEKAGVQDALSGINLVAISPTAGEPLASFCWNQTLLPPVANEQAMLHILNKE